jgi:hypothetical protein
MRLMTMVMSVLVTTSCASPMALRGARVLERGEVEVLASVQMLTGPVREEALIEPAVSPSFAKSITPEVSLRTGIAERVDLQLRLTPMWLPELSGGVQLLGDPARNDDIAVTLTGGVRPSYPSDAGYILAFPAQLLVEVPMSDTISLTGGARVNTFASVGQQIDLVGVSPGAVGGVRVHWGNLVVQPELAFAAGIGAFGVGYTGTSSTPSSMLASFGLNVGGQFDFAWPTPSPRSSRSQTSTPSATSSAPPSM